MVRSHKRMLKLRGIHVKPSFLMAASYRMHGGMARILVT